MKRSARVAKSELSPSLSVRPQWCSKTWPSWKSSKAWPFGTSAKASKSGSAMASAYVARTHAVIRGGFLSALGRGCTCHQLQLERRLGRLVHGDELESE